MGDILGRYDRRAGAFTEKVRAVPEDRWESPSPCEGWTARDVVGHVVDTHRMFLGFVDHAPDAFPSVDDDPLAAWEAARDSVRSDLADPQRAMAEYDGFTGRSTFEQGIDGFISFDLVVHGWDLARAVGLDERIDPADVSSVFKRARQFGDAMRGPRAFGPEVEPPPDADEQTRLLAFLGRRAWT